MVPLPAPPSMLRGYSGVLPVWQVEHTQVSGPALWFQRPAAIAHTGAQAQEAPQVQPLPFSYAPALWQQ